MKQAFLISGLVLIILAVLMLPCLLVDIYYHQSFYLFEISILLILLCDLVCLLCGKGASLETIKDANILFITACIWIIIIFFSIIPFKLYGLSYVDSLFETISGLTTTGATILEHLKDHSKGILLWRAILHLIGGLGIIIFAIIIFLVLKSPGLRHLFYNEFSDQADGKFYSSRIAIAIFTIYLFLIATCFIAYYILGMSIFDAVCHSFATISTGGFTNYDESFAYYNNSLLDFIAVIFMALSALPFIWLAKIVYKRKIVFDEQVIYFLAIAILVTLTSAFSLYYWSSYTKATSFLSSLRYSIFSTVSLMSTTGFVNSDYSVWVPCFPGLAIFFLMFLGGCAGSTAGGIKMVRIIILAKNVKRELQLAVNSSQLREIIFHNHIVDYPVILGISSFLILYLLIFVICSLILALCGYDYITCLSAVAATLTNSGPGLSELIGPNGNYSSLTNVAKITLCSSMLLGRLEIVTIITFFMIIFSKIKKIQSP